MFATVYFIYSYIFNTDIDTHIIDPYGVSIDKKTVQVLTTSILTYSLRAVLLLPIVPSYQFIWLGLAQHCSFSLLHIKHKNTGIVQDESFCLDENEPQ